MTTGKPEHLKWMRSQLEGKYTVKTQTLGFGNENKQQIKISNRVVTRDDAHGISYEADPSHVEIKLKQLQMEEARTVTAPGIKDDGTTTGESNVALGDKEATSYMALVARCNYPSPDRPDTVVSAKELARSMPLFTHGDWHRLRKVGQIFKGEALVIFTISMANDSVECDDL